MFGKRKTEVKTVSLRDYLEAGMQKPYRTYTDKEMLADACKYVGVFTSVHNSMGYITRTIAIGEAGSCIGGLEENWIKDQITELLLRCCDLETNETLTLTDEDRKFLKAGIEGSLYKPFYEL